MNSRGYLFSLTLIFAFCSIDSALSMDSVAEGMTSKGKRVKPIQTLCGESLHKKIRQDAQSDDYNLLATSLQQLGPERLSDLVYGEVCRPDLPFKPRLMQYMTKIDLSCALEEHLEEHPKCLSVLEQSPYLRYLDLSDNSLNGNVISLQNLTRLTHLNLSSNHLGSFVPPLKVTLRRLTNLISLDISGNYLNGNITTLQPLTSLTYLNIKQECINAHRALRETLLRFTRLTHLDVGGNNLAGNITMLQPLTGLTYLGTEANMLRGHVPALEATLHSLMSLTGLSLLNNDLGGDRITILRPFTRLTTLNLGSNSLGEFAPVLQVTLQALPQITNLDIRDNGIGEHVTVLQPLTGLAILNLAGNSLGRHVGSLHFFTNLRSLDLSHNDLAAHEIPMYETLRALTWLENINVDCNKFNPNQVRGLKTYARQSNLKLQLDYP